MKRKRLGIGIIVFAVLSGTAWYGHRLFNDRAWAAHYIPATPDTTDRVSSFKENLAQAEQRGRNLFRARAGLVELSRLYHANGFYSQALACYEGLIRMDEANPRWAHLQASIMSSFGRMDEALPLSQKAVKLAPDYIPARLRLGDILLKTNRVPDAVQAYNEVLRREPEDPYALLGLARCDLSAGDWAKARERLQAALVKRPDFVGALSLLVTVSEHFKEFATAESYKNAMNLRVFSDLPDPWVDELSSVCFDAYLLSVAASTANFAGNKTVTMDLINRAIALAPNISTYRRQAGQYLLQENDFSSAKVQLEKAVEVNPTDSDSWLRYLQALRGLQQSQQFLAALLKGLSHCPESSGLHLEYARYLKSANRLNEAIAEFRYGYQLRPSEASPLVELATTYLTAGRTNEAVDALNLALQRQPDHPSALATLAFIAIGANDEMEARRRLEQIRRQAKAPPELIGRLIQAYQQQFGRTQN